MNEEIEELINEIKSQMIEYGKTANIVILSKDHYQKLREYYKSSLGIYDFYKIFGLSIIAIDCKNLIKVSRKVGF